MSLDLGTPNQWMLHLDLDLRLAAAALLVARPKLGRETPIDTATWGGSQNSGTPKWSVLDWDFDGFCMIFPYKPSSFFGIPISGNHQMMNIDDSSRGIVLGPWTAGNTRR